MSPTTKTYISLTSAYEHFNRELFSNDLPACLITMQRQRGAYGYLHLWQYHQGEQKARTSWHNKEWARKICEIGLIPSNTGLPGGKEIGQKMSHYIDRGGRFNSVCDMLISSAELSLYNDRDEETKTARKKKAASKTKYTCLAVTSTPGLNRTPL